MSYDLRNELGLDAEKAWGNLRDQDKNTAIAQLETLCVRRGMEWGSNDQRKAMVIWRFYNLQIAANKVHKRNQAKGNIGSKLETLRLYYLQRFKVEILPVPPRGFGLTLFEIFDGPDRWHGGQRLAAMALSCVKKYTTGLLSGQQSYHL